MPPSLYKFFAIIFIFLGEALAIFAEMVAARTKISSFQNISKIFFSTFIFIVAGGLLLILGYILGFKEFKNIWIVSVISITSILIIEPILAFAIFRQLPTRGAILGLVLGILGFLSALFWKQ